MKAKRKLTLLDKVFLWVNCGLALALLISYLAPLTDPQTMWVIAFFGLAYPPLLLANVLMVLFWLLRKNRFALISALTILIGFNVLFNNIGFHPGNSNVAKPNTANAIRFMTYNVHEFKKYGEKKDISTKHEILELISQQDPDIIGIQEFFSRRVGVYNLLDSMQKIMGTNYYYKEEFHHNRFEYNAIAIFSKWPIINTGFIRLSTERSSENQCLYIDVKKNGQVFRVYSIHLQSIKFGSRDYQYLDTVSKSGKADLSSTRRLAGKLKRAFIKRSEQVDMIKESTKQCPYPYIIAGDFNDTPSSYAVNQLDKGLKNTFREKGFGLGRTYNGDFPNYQIDYVMVSPKFDVRSYTIIEKKLSDHYPVCVDLELK